MDTQTFIRDQIYIKFSFQDHDLDERIECILCEFADDVELGRSAALLEDRKTLQRDLARLHWWTKASFTRFNKPSDGSCTPVTTAP